MDILQVSFLRNGRCVHSISLFGAWAGLAPNVDPIALGISKWAGCLACFSMSASFKHVDLGLRPGYHAEQM